MCFRSFKFMFWNQTYTCYTKRNIENIPKGVALCIRRICDSDEKFDVRSSKYHKYLIATNYKPSLVKKQFNAVKHITRSTARQTKTMTENKSVGLVTLYNPIFTDINKISIYLCCIVILIRNWFFQKAPKNPHSEEGRI